MADVGSLTTQLGLRSARVYAHRLVTQIRYIRIRELFLFDIFNELNGP